MRIVHIATDGTEFGGLAADQQGGVEIGGAVAALFSVRNVPAAQL